ncbi:MAG: iron-containing alcohol dehydrogenase [Petrimonas sp.]|nr:iron-containing alcohol dehydrogenase [Petrimonas sp.]
MNYMNFQNTTYTIGNGSIASLENYGDGKIALVVDSSIMKALKLDEKVYNGILKNSAFEVICDMQQEPTMELLKQPIKRIREYEPKYIVGIGGGSVMDTAKALWLFYELPHYSWEEAFKPFAVEHFPGKASLIVVPTTSGTGSETTGCSVIKDYDKHKKMILSNEILPTKAILDFELLQSLPLKNIAYSGTDALAHALEAATSKLASGMVKHICCEAAVTIIKRLPDSYTGNLEAREDVHIAATMAGAGINNAITGVSHGMDCAGGDFGLPHGLVTGMLLPYTMRYIMPHPFYNEVADRLGINGSEEQKQTKLIDMIWEMYGRINMPRTFAEVGVDEQKYLANIPSYVEHAKADNNLLCASKEFSEEQLEQLYKEFYYGIA